jgi:5-methylcytosine-specific restriction endonuclease McrA
MASSLSNKGSTSKWRRLRAQVLRRDNNTCFYCGQYADTVDHIVPRSKLIDQNADTVDNLVAACKKCNYSKGGRFFVGRETPSTPLSSFPSQNGTIVHYQDKSDTTAKDGAES